MSASEILSPSRRAFLRGKAQEPALLRPPWARPESKFLESCTRCGDCVSACPQGVLVRADGDFPTFDPARNECTFCSACATACSTTAIQHVEGQKPWTLTAQIASTCLALNSVACFSCRDACGDSAIQFRIGKGVATPTLNADRCTGCGACVSVCPVTAISLTRLDGPHG